jgi:hypothetical protein
MMSAESKLSRSYMIIAKASIFAIFGMVPTPIIVWILNSAVLIDGSVRLYALLISVCCIIVGSAFTVFLSPSKKNLLLWASGFILSAGVLLLSWFLSFIIFILAFPLETLLCSIVLGSIAVYLYSTYFSTEGNKMQIAPSSEVFSFSRLPLSRQLFVGGYELKEIPEIYLQSSSENSSGPRRYKKFLDVLRGLTLAGIPLALRIERVADQTCVYFLTWDKLESVLAERMVRLEDRLRSNLSGMRFIVRLPFKGISLQKDQERAVSSLSGEPLSIEDEGQGEDALTVTARVLQSMSDGVIQISCTPRRSDSRQLKRLEDEYAAEVRRSEQVVSVPRRGLFSDDTTESTTRVDTRAQRNALSLRKRIDRLSESYLCEVQVSVLCWDTDRKCAEENSRRLIDALRGNLAPADSEHALVVETHSKVGVTAHLLRGEPVGKGTVLSLSEAIVYLIIPFCDLGIPVVGHASFLSNPQDLRPSSTNGEQERQEKRRVLTLGRIVDDSGREAGAFELPIDDLASHSGNFGDTGSGKTTTQIKILLELARHGINFLVLLVSKSEDYVRLKKKIKNLYVFTIGDSTVAPARFCLTNFRQGIHVSSIINCIKTAFVASKPADGMVKEYLEMLIELTFRRLGWDRETNTRGLPIIIQDFLDTLPLLKKRLQYSLRGNEDFQGAIYGRICSFFSGALSSVFGTTSGLSVEEIVQQPTLVLMDKLSKDEYCFVTFWLVSNLVLHYEALKKAEKIQTACLKYYVILEEAHRFLVGEKGMNVNEEHAAQQAAIEAISLAMQEARSSGLGFGLATQKPAQLNSQACEMVMNVFVHRKTAEADRRVLGGQMGCNEGQILMMGSLPTGQSVIRTASSARPVRVIIDSSLDSLLENAVSDEEIRADMKPVFEASPHFQDSPDFAMSEPELGDLSDAFSSIQLDMQGLRELYLIISFLHNRRYQSGIAKAIQSQDYLPIALLIKNLARSVVPQETSPLFHSLHLLWYFTNTEEEWTDNTVREVQLQLARILPADQNEVLHDLDVLHERVCLEITERLKSRRIDAEREERVVRQAIKTASDELQKTRAASIVIDSSRTNEHPPPSICIEAIVRSDDFRGHYISRMKRATEGDLTSIIRFVGLLAKRINSPLNGIDETAAHILNQGRAIYGSPVDDDLWERICEKIQSKISEEGSESAA